MLGAHLAHLEEEDAARSGGGAAVFPAFLAGAAPADLAPGLELLAHLLGQVLAPAP